MKTMQDFTNLYSLSKTLRFELIPQGKPWKTSKRMVFLKMMNTGQKATKR